MKMIFLFLALVLSSNAILAHDITVMTFNIRLHTASDSLNAWPYRKDKVASQIVYHKVTLLGVQEALYDQMTDLQQRLPGYRSVGGGRDDGRNKGEHSAIFFDTARLQLQQSDMLWLSETPEKAGSKGWDAAFPRVITWAKFRDKKTGSVFFAFNTHFDHMGQVARRESAKMVLQKVKEIAGSAPAIFTGDFNATPFDEPIRIIVDNNNPLRLTDSKELSEQPHYGPTGTFNAFKSKERDDHPIDYIFLKGSWKVHSHATISQSWQGRFASDHFAVIAVISL